MIAARLYGVVDPGSPRPAARIFRCVHHAMVVVGVAALVFDTASHLTRGLGLVLTLAFDVALAFFTLEYLARLVAAPQAPWTHAEAPWRARWLWAKSFPGVVDLVAVLPVVTSILLGPEPPSAKLIGAVWIVKLARYSTGLGVVGRVLRQERGPLLSVMLAFTIVLLLSATLAYVVESPYQPDTFGSIPAALWWAIATLTTTGYGDVVPITGLGRLIGGAVMICGVGVLAFLAGILATGFQEEMRRHEFLRTWDLVSRVPFFDKVGAGTIAEVTRLLKRAEVPPGTVVVRRGQPGDCMYFIVSGEIEVQIKPNPLRLGAGDFFGEIALITGAPRNATAVATQPCQLLSLDIAAFRELAARRPELTQAIDQEAKRRIGTAKAGEGPEPRSSAPA